MNGKKLLLFLIHITAMGRMKDLYIDLMNKRMQDLPLGAQNDPAAPWNEKELSFKDCPDCQEVPESNCCSAPIILTDICSDCKEHCNISECPTCGGCGYVEKTTDDLQDEEDYIADEMHESNKDI